MSSYLLRRLLLIIPTLLGIMTLNFLVVQLAPGGPVEQMVAKLEGISTENTRLTGNLSSVQQNNTSNYRGNQGIDPEILAEIEKMYGFDKPLYQRYLSMLGDYALLDFGESFYRDKSVVGLVAEKMPVSISLGVWSTLLVYLISIPLGVYKALNHGTRIDHISSTFIIVAYAIPGFLLGILLIILFAGGNYLDWFPLRGLTSENFAELSLGGKIIDYFHHLVLPVLATSLGGFATLTLLTKNSFLDEINKQYVTTAKAKGLDDQQVLYNHVFRNAMLIVIAGFPAAFVGMFFTSALLIEVIFSLDGLGLLGFEAIQQRDYPVIFGTLYIFTLIGLLVKLLSDLSYSLIDPRIDFEARD